MKATTHKLLEVANLAVALLFGIMAVTYASLAISFLPVKEEIPNLLGYYAGL